MRSIWVTFSKEGIHKYPAALEDPNLATGDWDDVGFLGIARRHIFHFRVRIQVFHNDRDIEFIQFKRWITPFKPFKPFLTILLLFFELLYPTCGPRSIFHN